MSTGLFAQYATDASLENDGAPYVRCIYEERPEGEREETYVLARLDENANKGYGKALRAARRRHAAQIRTNSMGEDLDRQITLEIFVDHILKGWKNVVVDAPIPGKQGKLPYTRANALWLLTKLPDLYQELRYAAAEAALFKDEQFMGEAKRSPTTSDGSSSTVSEPESLN